MKKSIFYSIAAIVALAACSKEADVIVPTGETVTIIASAPQTKSTESHASFSWAAGEQISVGTSDDEYVTFTVSDTENGLFTHTFPQGTPTPDLLVAVSPVQAEELEFVAGSYEVALPEVYQDYDPSAGVTNALMIGTPDPNVENRFLFRHAAALLKVTYANVPVGTSSFHFSADAPIAGTVILEGTDVDLIEIANDNAQLEDGSEEVWINLANTVTQPYTTMTFYVPVPTGDYSMLCIELLNAAGIAFESSVKFMDRTGKSPLTLARGDVFNFPTITLEPEPIVENFSCTKTTNKNYGSGVHVETAGNADDFDFSWTPTGNVFVFQDGIRFGTGSANGSVTSSDILSAIPAGQNFTVKVYAAIGGTDNGKLAVVYNGTTLEETPSSSIENPSNKDYSADDFDDPAEFVFTKTADADALTIGSTAKRIIVDKVEIVLGGTIVPVENLTVTPSSENPETVSYEGGVMSYSVTAENIDTWDAVSDNEAFVVTKSNDGFVVTVAENESTSPRSATITVTGGTKTVTFDISQEGAPAVIETLTIAQFLAKEVGDTYYQLTGKLTNLVNTSYGNFTLVDETGSVYVYGLTKTQKSTNDQSFGEIGLEEGDFVTLVGKRADYKGTAQVGGPAYYVSHIDAPVITVSPTEKTVLASETSVEIAITSNADWTITTGEGITADPSSGNGNSTVTLTFAARTVAGDATLVATVTADIDPDVYETVTITQHGTDYTAPTGWVETALADIVAGDVFAMVANDTYALPHDGSSAPALVTVAVSDGKLTGTIPSNIQWNLTGDAKDGYTFYPNGNNAKYLRCTTTTSSGNNDNLRISTGTRNAFILDSGGHILTYDDYTDRYIGINGTSNFRGYVTPTSATEAIFKFYKFFDDGKVDPEVSFSTGSATITWGQPLTQPTLTKPADLSVSFASNNTAVATVDESTGTITVVKPGTATITASWDESATYHSGHVDYVLTVNKAAASVAFSDPVLTVAVNGTQTNVATTTPSGLTVTYSSSNTTAATVGQTTGTVTGLQDGTAVITATFAGNDFYESASDSYTITVGTGGSSAHYYTKVTSISDITSGGSYIIVANTDRAMVVSGDATAMKKPASASVTINNNKIESNSTTDAYAVTLTNTTNGYTISFVSGGTTYYLEYNSSTNFTLVESPTKWFTVSAASDYGTFVFADTSTASASTKRGLVYRAGNYDIFGAYSITNPNGTEYFHIDLYKYE